METAFPIEIFFDGSCLVCATEMENYRNTNPDNRFVFVDISAAEFDAAEYGKTSAEFMAELHVRDANGVFYTGVDAFSTIWQAYPDFSFWRQVSALINLPGISLLSRFGYRLFARYRHLLPARAAQCDSGTCTTRH